MAAVGLPRPAVDGEVLGLLAVGLVGGGAVTTTQLEPFTIKRQVRDDT